MNSKCSKGWKVFDFTPNGPEEPDVIKVQKPESKFNETVKKETTCMATSHHRLPKVENLQSKLIPNTIGDLAVHPKKVQEVEEWFKQSVCRNLETSPPLLLLSGPSGSGKNATVNVICKLLNITISEWINPVDQDYEYKGQTQIQQFLEFLVESKWHSLFEKSTQKITLVKDFPNALLHQPDRFINILEECYDKTNSPIVFICTETGNRDIDLEKLLFPENIIKKFNIKHISFNPCAPSLMKVAVKRAQELIKDYPGLLKPPSATSIDAILASAMGDIRNAMNQFYIASLIGSKDLPTMPNIGQSNNRLGQKRKRNTNVQLKSMLRDETLGLFHGLGRVLNPKRKEVGSSWRFSYDIEKLVDEFSTQPAMFTSFLFENYIKYFGDIHDASRATEILSLSAKFLENWVDRHETFIFALWISVLGVMIYNEHQISKWNQIRGPTKIKKCVNNDMEVAGLKSTDYFYYNLITKSEKFHRFSNIKNP